MPGAPAQQPPAGMPPGAPGMSPAGPVGAAPGSSVSATLTPAESGTPAPSAHLYETKLTGNYFIDKFRQGGPVMWPILLVSIVALTVVIERIFWWGGRWFRRDPKRIEKVFTAIENNDVAEASRLSRDSRDPVLRMMWNGLNHQHASLQGALQVAAGIEIKRAGRFLVVMDTLVTLAPLLAGGDDPEGRTLRIVAGDELPAPAEMELASVLESESQLFLRYLVRAPSGSGSGELPSEAAAVSAETTRSKSLAS